MVDTVKILGALLGGGNMSSGSGSNVLGSVLGAVLSGGNSGGSQSGGPDLGGLLNSVLGGGQGGARPAGRQGGMQAGASPGGGLGDLLGSVLGGGGQAGGGQGGGGGLGDLLGGVLGGATQGGSGNAGAGLSELIGAALSQFGHAEQAAAQGRPAPQFEEHSHGMAHSQACEQATVMVRAMINAAKSDGRVDREEQQKILGKLGSVSQDEVDFVNEEISRPLDVGGFARSVPRGMENQVYAMSLMAIDLDSQGEARYLHQLGQAMGIQPQVANQIHDQLGAPKLYS
jgi:uncharacterized membrane protein YebE (DUF533 family)